MMTSDRLAAEWQRLFLLPEALAASGNQPDPASLCRLVSPETSTVRTLVIDFKRASDWPAVAGLYESLQLKEELPAPLIAVTPRGYQMWFSLADPVSLADARHFLLRLQSAYLAELMPGCVELLPAASGELSELPVIPAEDPETQKWAAFIDPGMGSMFLDEPGLDIAPNPERQADILASAKSISTEDIRRLLAAERLAAGIHSDGVVDPQSCHVVLPGTNFSDPREFLLMVMNSTHVSIADRVAAARALLKAATRTRRN